MIQLSIGFRDLELVESKYDITLFWVGNCIANRPCFKLQAIVFDGVIRVSC